MVWIHSSGAQRGDALIYRICTRLEVQRIKHFASSLNFSSFLLVDTKLSHDFYEYTLLFGKFYKFVVK